MEADRPEGIVTHRGERQRDRMEDGRRVRVLFVMIQMAMGGSERVVLNLIKNLDRGVFEPSVAWFHHQKPLEEFEALRVPLYYIPKRTRFDWTAMRRLAVTVRDGGIDLVNAHHFMPFFYSYYGAKVANRVPLVYTEHSEADVSAVRSSTRTLGRYLLRSSDASIGVTDTVSRTLMAQFGLDQRAVHTIENGVAIEHFGRSAARGGRLRQELGLSADTIVIGHIANLRRNKNHLFLLRAFREIARNRKDVTLVLLGQGQHDDAENSEPEIRRFIQDAGLEASVRLLGYRSDVREVLDILDVCCLVSYKEGLPLSLLEAMASGLPVIGTAIDGIRNVVEPGVNGVTVAPDDVAGLTSNLLRLIEDEQLRRQMGAASRRIAIDRYSLDRCIDETQRLFLSVLPQAPAESAPDVPRLAGTRS